MGLVLFWGRCTGGFLPGLEPGEAASFALFFILFKVLPLLKIKKNTFFKAGFLLLPLFVFLGILLCESIKRFYM